MMLPLSAVLVALAVLMLSLSPLSASVAQQCEPLTTAEIGRLPSTSYPFQYDRGVWEAQMGCALNVRSNPRMQAFNDRIRGNPPLPPESERLPQDALVIVPEDSIGSYGGIVQVISKSIEAGTADLMSIRHVSLVRYAPDLRTLMPDVARAWTWNEDFTRLTVQLRAGHRWSDGHPFTADDIVFWYNNLLGNRSIYTQGPPDRLTAGGTPFKVSAPNDVTVVFEMAVPKPGLLALFATDYFQPFQPKHFLGRFHPDVNPDYQREVAALGFEKWQDAVNFYYGASDWKDVPSPLLKDAARAAKGSASVVPTLEAMILVEQTNEGRTFVPNPYFFMVDTAGQQLPYFDGLVERHIPQKEVQNVMLTQGEVTYKSQSVDPDDIPILQTNEAVGGYITDIVPSVGEMVGYAFNVTHADPKKRAIFGDQRFRRAMSLAINREEANEIVYFGLGQPSQFTLFDPSTVSFITEEQRLRDTNYDPDAARVLLDEMGFVDRDGDGMRDHADGSSFVVDFVFATQGGSVRMHELFAQYAQEVGVRIKLREVTSDEYRSAQSSNQLDLAAWQTLYPSAFLAGSRDQFIPPFGTSIHLQTAVGWERYRVTNGKEGLAPPAWVDVIDKKSLAYQQEPQGSELSDALGREIVDLIQSDTIIIGTIASAGSPVYRSVRIANWVPFTAKAFSYYWAFSFRPYQWYFLPDDPADPTDSTGAQEIEETPATLTTSETVPLE